MSVQQIKDSASHSIESAFASLPPYWKLATLRCLIYSIVVANSTFDAGVEGYQSFKDMTQFQFWRLWCNVATAMLTTWVAFLDQSMTSIRNSSGSGITRADFEPEPAKPVDVPAPTVIK